MGSSTTLRRTARAGLVAIVAIGLALAPAAAAAHVNRTVGPYTFLVVLVEEPYFTSNHAGFEFWVHRGDTAVAGLDQTLHAQAIGHGRRVDLLISPIDQDGLYTVDRGLDLQPFDPAGGGDWSLRLTGSVEGTAIDEAFAVQFPAYPRVGTVKPATTGAAAAPSADGELVPPYLVLLLLGVGALVAVRSLRHGRISIPPFAMSSELDGQALEPSIGRRP
jgi:hypothetical protein